MDNVINLVQKNYTKDEIGQEIAIETETTIFCSIASVSREEFFTAGKSGIRPSLQLTINRYEYDGQKVCVVNGKRYAIYRTYIGKGETLELYLEEQSGIQ